MHLRRLILLTSAALAFPLHAAESWPQFRGPTGQGVAEGDAPTKWSPDSGVEWKTEIPGDGWSSPVIDSGKLVITTSETENGRMVLKARAYETETGKPAWERKLFEPTDDEIAARHAKNSFASSTPAIADGVVYIHFGHMGTAALDLDDGKVLWQRKISYKPMHGNGSSVVLHGDLMIVNADAEENPAIYALNRKDGSTAWKTPRVADVKRTFSFSTPTVIENGGRTEIISPGSGMVGAYAPKDGKLLWKATYDEGFSLIPRPIVAGGSVYVATGFMKPELLAIRLAGADGDVTKSHVEWHVKKRIPKTPSLIHYKSRIIALDDTGFVTGFDWKTGKEAWMKKLIGNFSSSPLLCGDTLYCLTEDGVAYVLEVSEEGAEIISEIDMGDRLFASPALLDGALYLRSEKALWKITGT
ncbi:serine/threonine protein kinase [Haloferula helveola]|uniref:Serine/threonine protein kinase n=1 Tax=Haloferula helveola TaxID=490095 RepID=A0ABM7RP15_9BACT|nr:serine/threonine protein kinase [Haloferula helveola]